MLPYTAGLSWLIAYIITVSGAYDNSSPETQQNCATWPSNSGNVLSLASWFRQAMATITCPPSTGPLEQGFACLTFRIPHAHACPFCALKYRGSAPLACQPPASVRRGGAHSQQ